MVTAWAFIVIFFLTLALIGQAVYYRAKLDELGEKTRVDTQAQWSDRR